MYVCTYMYVREVLSKYQNLFVVLNMRVFYYLDIICCVGYF